MHLAASTTQPQNAGRATRGAGLALGFALGGFFDGILLHQILQWHHLLSGVDAAEADDLRVQIFADGLFHAAMYVIGIAGVVMLYRARLKLHAPLAGQRLLAAAFMGFGTWHVLDAVLSHWLLGIHRIRQDSAFPLFWDIMWLVGFGILPLALAHMLTPETMAGGGNRGGGRPVALFLVAALAVSASVAALPPPGSSGAIVVFRPGMDPGEIVAALAAIDATPMWSDRSGQVWGIDLASPELAGGLYRHGAWLVSRSLLPTGCLGWTRPA